MLFTEYLVLITMLSNYIQRAMDINTEPKLEVSIPQTLSEKDIDITIIPGNTIDNALYAFNNVPNDKD